MLWHPRAQCEAEVVHPNIPDSTLILHPHTLYTEAEIHREAEARGQVWWGIEETRYFQGSLLQVVCLQDDTVHETLVLGLQKSYPGSRATWVLDTPKFLEKLLELESAPQSPCLRHASTGPFPGLLE